MIWRKWFIIALVFHYTSLLHGFTVITMGDSQDRNFLRNYCNHYHHKQPLAWFPGDEIGNCYNCSFGNNHHYIALPMFGSNASGIYYWQEKISRKPFPYKTQERIYWTLAQFKQRFPDIVPNLILFHSNLWDFKYLEWYEDSDQLNIRDSFIWRKYLSIFRRNLANRLQDIHLALANLYPNSSSTIPIGFHTAIYVPHRQVLGGWNGFGACYNDASRDYLHGMNEVLRDFSFHYQIPLLDLDAMVWEYYGHDYTQCHRFITDLKHTRDEYSKELGPFYLFERYSHHFHLHGWQPPSTSHSSNSNRHNDSIGSDKNSSNHSHLYDSSVTNLNKNTSFSVSTSTSSSSSLTAPLSTSTSPYNDSNNNNYYFTNPATVLPDTAWLDFPRPWLNRFTHYPRPRHILPIYLLRYQDLDYTKMTPHQRANYTYYLTYSSSHAPYHHKLAGSNKHNTNNKLSNHSLPLQLPLRHGQVNDSLLQSLLLFPLPAVSSQHNSNSSSSNSSNSKSVSAKQQPAAASSLAAATWCCWRSLPGDIYYANRQELEAIPLGMPLPDYLLAHPLIAASLIMSTKDVQASGVGYGAGSGGGKQGA